MCYTIKIDKTREALEKRFGARFNDPDQYIPGTKVNAFSLPVLPVICSDQPEQISLYTWGLIPFWTRNEDGAEQIRKKTFNARSESLLEKPSYRHLLYRRHCLVLTNGFYEWYTDGKTKIPYYIGVKDQPAFALAGLYDHWINRRTGEIIKTFTVVTTKANPMMEEIHNLKKRMPVILDDETEKNWLQPEAKDAVRGIFNPFPQERMFAEKLT